MSGEGVAPPRGRPGPDRRLPPALRIGFLLLTLLAIGHVGTALAEQWPAIVALDLPRGWETLLLGLSLAYALGLFLLAELWHRLATAAVGRPLPRRRTYPSYTTTQIAKYLPGNVFHLVGRHMLLRREGGGHRELGLALMMEAVVLVAAAGLVGLSATVAAPPASEGVLPGLLARLGPMALGAALVAILAVAVAMRRSRAPCLRDMSRAVPAGLMLALLFFTLQAAIFALLADALGAVDAWRLAGLAPVAWIAGFLVPGAPGGLGPREAVLLILSGGAMAEDVALAAALLLRVVTTLGDVGCFLLGRAIGR